ncbi:MAG: hypothetical protein U9R02_08050, partial [Thermodesulfobacteriota bacterium]|nr:hypothetical protein [Thermodesulfobacteriota bacterium]
MVFQFCLEISNFLRLLSFFNLKLKTKNSKPCLNRVFVQALINSYQLIIKAINIKRDAFRHFVPYSNLTIHRRGGFQTRPYDGFGFTDGFQTRPYDGFGFTDGFQTRPYDGFQIHRR